jgi:hypothetical protein
MLALPPTIGVPVIRAEFSDDRVWAQLRHDIASPTPEGFFAQVDFVEMPALAGWDETALLEGIPKVYPSRYEHPVLFVVDAVTVSSRDHPVLVLDLSEEGACEPFRSTPRQVQAIQNNLSLCNMDFHEFADAADADGIFRGF